MCVQDLDSTTMMIKEEHQTTFSESERKELNGLSLFVSATAIVTDAVVKEGCKKEYPAPRYSNVYRQENV